MSDETTYVGATFPVNEAVSPEQATVFQVTETEPGVGEQTEVTPVEEPLVETPVEAERGDGSQEAPEPSL